MIGEYEVKYEGIIPHHQAAVELFSTFEEFYIDHVPWHGNVYINVDITFSHSGITSQIKQVCYHK